MPLTTMEDAMQMTEQERTTALRLARERLTAAENRCHAANLLKLEAEIAVRELSGMGEDTLTRIMRAQLDCNEAEVKRLDHEFWAEAFVDRGTQPPAHLGVDALTAAVDRIRTARAALGTQH